MYPSVHTVQIPWLSIANIIIELQRLILGENTDGIDAGIHAIGERKVNDTVFSTIGHGRLGDIFVRIPSRLPCPPARSIAMHSFFGPYMLPPLFYKIDFMKSVEINSRGFDQVDLASGETGFAFCGMEPPVQRKRAFSSAFFTLLCKLQI